MINKILVPILFVLLIVGTVWGYTLIHTGEEIDQGVAIAIDIGGIVGIIESDGADTISSYDFVTSMAGPGSDTQIPSEKAIVDFIIAIPPGSGVEEAPVDTTSYVREDGDWVSAGSSYDAIKDFTTVKKLLDRPLADGLAQRTIWVDDTCTYAGAAFLDNYNGATRTCATGSDRVYENPREAAFKGGAILSMSRLVINLVGGPYEDATGANNGGNMEFPGNFFSARMDAGGPSGTEGYEYGLVIDGDPDADGNNVTIASVYAHGFHGQAAISLRNVNVTGAITRNNSSAAIEFHGCNSFHASDVRATGAWAVGRSIFSVYSSMGKLNSVQANTTTNPVFALVHVKRFGKVALVGPVTGSGAYNYIAREESFGRVAFWSDELTLQPTIGHEYTNSGFREGIMLDHDTGELIGDFEFTGDITAVTVASSGTDAEVLANNPNGKEMTAGGFFVQTEDFVYRNSAGTQSRVMNFRSLISDDLSDTTSPHVLVSDNAGDPSVHSEVHNVTISSYDSTGAVRTFTMPTCAEADNTGNLIFVIGGISGGPWQVDIEPKSGDLFYLNELAMAVDEHIENPGDTLGQRIVGTCSNIEGTYRWMFNGGDGWVEATPPS